MKGREIAETSILSPLRAYRTDMNGLLSHKRLFRLNTCPNVIAPFLPDYRVIKASAWRFEKRGWLRTHLIANKRYILAADVAEFNRRLASDEFAGRPKILPVTRAVG